MRSFYITTTLPYVNADPHLGFAQELVYADVQARYFRIRGDEVFLNTGTDEHGLKVYRKAHEEKKDPQEHVDMYAERFKTLARTLGIVPDVNFIRTTDENHKKAAQEFWRRCDKNGYIYKKEYVIKYCVGCELEKTDSEFEGGRCSLHPNQEVETIEEENYFFAFSRFQDKLLDLYKERPNFVQPDFRFNEVKAFVARGLEDFSISRRKEKMPWGVSVPGDNEHVMYVWFDALVNYISAIGWPDDIEKFNKWWPVIQLAGKDQIRQQAAMWQAMLMAAGINEPSKTIFIHGFITHDGQKMSKSLGNVINPIPLVDKYGVDALRYYITRHLNPYEDNDFTGERFRKVYNANLANGLGNLVSRVMKLAETHLEKPVAVADENVEDATREEYRQAMERFEIQKAADVIWKRIGELDRFIQKNEPFKTIKTDANKAKKDIAYLVSSITDISSMLTPFMPGTAEKIKQAIVENKMPETLFARK